MNTRVISVAEYADESTRSGILQSDFVRRETLDRCYNMDGYKDLPTAEKNKVYDRIKAEVMKEYC